MKSTPTKPKISSRSKSAAHNPLNSPIKAEPDNKLDKRRVSQEKKTCEIECSPVASNYILQNIQVHVRIRPPTRADELLGSTNSLICFGDNKIEFHNRNKDYMFDKVYKESTSQIELFEASIKSNLSKSLEGYNYCILAYGQTGSGKTYTIGSSYSNDINPETEGILPRICSYIFEEVEASKSVSQYLIKASFYEIYNEEIRDLLHIKTPSKLLQVKEDKKGTIYITGITEHVVSDTKDCMNLLWTGSLNRKVGSTFQNDASSRSHAIFILNIIKTNSNTKDSFNFKISVVDLAGSEKMKKSGASGERLKEGININSGLLCLSKVVMALSEEQKHVPYRESKLTRILKDSLGGNSITLMIACVSPSEANYEESINTLNYASFTKSIKIKAAKNFQIDDELESLKKENEELKATITQLQKSSNLISDNYELKNEIQSLRSEIVKLKELSITQDVILPSVTILDEIPSDEIVLLREEVDYLRDKEEVLISKLEIAASILGDQGREELALSEENLEIMSNSELKKLIRSKNKEIERLKQLLDKYVTMSLGTSKQTVPLETQTLELKPTDLKADEKEKGLVAYHLSKLKSFQETLKKKILDAELFKKKILIEKNEEIKQVKRNLTEKEREIKQLVRIKEDNEMMLQLTTKEIVNLKEEIKKRTNSYDGRRNSGNTNGNGPSNSRNTSNEKVESRLEIAIPTQNLRVSNYRNSSKTFARPPSENKKPQPNQATNFQTLSTSTNINAAKLRENLTRNVTQTTQIATNNYNTGEVNSIKAKSLQKFPAFVDAKEQLIVTNIHSLLRKLEELNKEKSKLANRTQTLYKGDEPITSSNLAASLKEINKQKIEDQKNYDNTIKYESVQSNMESNSKELEDCRLALKDLLNKLTDRIECLRYAIVGGKENLEFDDKLVYLELDNMSKDKRIADLENHIKQMSDDFESKLLLAKIEGSSVSLEDSLGLDNYSAELHQTVALHKQTTSTSYHEMYSTNTNRELLNISKKAPSKKKIVSQLKESLPKPTIPKNNKPLNKN